MGDNKMVCIAFVDYLSHNCGVKHCAQVAPLTPGPFSLCLGVTGPGNG